jgi:hypothetical protein
MDDAQLKERLETLGGLIATTAVMAITNSATLSILAITHRGECGKATADAHAKQRGVLIELLKEAGVDLPKLREMNELANKAVEDYQQRWDNTGGLKPLTCPPK